MNANTDLASDNDSLLRFHSRLLASIRGSVPQLFKRAKLEWERIILDRNR